MQFIFSLLWGYTRFVVIHHYVLSRKAIFVFRVPFNPAQFFHLPVIIILVVYAVIQVIIKVLRSVRAIHSYIQILLSHYRFVSNWRWADKLLFFHHPFLFFLIPSSLPLLHLSTLFLVMISVALWKPVYRKSTTMYHIIRNRKVALMMRVPSRLCDADVPEAD